MLGCASGALPEAKHERHRFPEERVYVEEPVGQFAGRAYSVLGWVRSKANFSTLQNETNDGRLCRNYYNKAARSLLKEAMKVGAEAVIKVRSVVFLLDGKLEYHASPECSDDGSEGEVLLQGIAIKFKPLEPAPIK
jgi:hypothetical protein